MTIKAHCMGMEFPKRDTDSPNVIWESAKPTIGHSVPTPEEWAERLARVAKRNEFPPALPSAADLDAVAEEQRVKEKTSAQVPNR